jgi:two-component system response regulator RegA
VKDPIPSLLIVDDDEVLRLRLGRAFSARGFDTYLASGPAEALALARSESPEMAVVDLKMPGGSGLELVRDLIAIDPSTRIVVLTGHGSIATAIEAVRLGATYYLPKPADADDILAAFERGAAPPLSGPRPEHPVPSLARAEYEHIQRVLHECAGNVSEAARRLGIHRRSLQRKIQKAPPRD